MLDRSAYPLQQDRPIMPSMTADEQNFICVNTERGSSYYFCHKPFSA